jgi:hypothetical protein
MACGCDSKMGCTCALQGGQGIVVSGSGSSGDPFIIDSTIEQVGVADTASLDLTKTGGIVSGKVSLAPLLGIADTASIDLTLAGSGVEASPYVLSGAVKGVDFTGATGSVLTKKPDGTWGPGPATQAPAGAVVSANGIVGDGSGGSPVRLNLRTYAQWEAMVDAST